jgi:proteasome activator subunit 3 (PA28 gamma)
MDSYKQNCIAQAKELLQNTIPEKLQEIDLLLETDRLKTEYADEARQFAIDSLKEYEDAIKEIELEQRAQAEAAEAAETGSKDDDDDAPPAPKKSKSSKLSMGLKSKTSLTETQMPKVPVNEKVLDLMTILKPELIQLGTNCQILKDWIHIHVPKHEDGNNFGVEVQEEALQELAAVKEESMQTIEEQSSYHLARANILEKITQDGNIEDLKVFIYDEDEKQCRRLRNVAMSLRTNYTNILDLITKNCERIIQPKGSTNVTAMY